MSVKSQKYTWGGWASKEAEIIDEVQNMKPLMNLLLGVRQ